MVLNKVCLPSNIGVQQSCQQCWMMRNLFDPGPTTSNDFIAELENRKFSVGTREYSAEYSTSGAECYSKIVGNFSSMHEKQVSFVYLLYEMSHDLRTLELVDKT